MEAAKKQEEAKQTEKLKAAHHLINLFPDMALPEAMELSLDDIHTRINNRIAEIESTQKIESPKSLNEPVDVKIEGKAVDYDDKIDYDHFTQSLIKVVEEKPTVSDKGLQAKIDKAVEAISAVIEELSKV